MGKKRPSILKLLLWIVIVLVIAGIGFVGYLFVLSGAIQSVLEGPLEPRTVRVFHTSSSIKMDELDTAPTEITGKDSDSRVVEEVFGDEWYRYHLNEQEVVIYDAIKAGFLATQLSIEIPQCDTETLNKCYQYVLADNPDIFWIDNSYEYMMYPANEQVFAVNPTFRAAASDKGRMQEDINRAKNEALERVKDDMNDYDKARELFQWVTEFLTYDENKADDQVLGIVCQRRTTACGGYSKLYQYLCRAAGLKCIYLEGEGKTEEGNILHAWNGIVIDGKPTYVDVTWGDRDGKKGLEYDLAWLALCSKHMNETHVPESADIAIEATEEANELWRRSDSSFETFDEQSVLTKMKSAVDEGWNTLTIYFNRPEDVDVAHDSLATSSTYPTELYRAHPDRFPLAFSEGVYSVRKAIGLNAITITFRYE